MLERVASPPDYQKVTRKELHIERKFRNDPDMLAHALSHELGHAFDEYPFHPFKPGMTKKDFVRELQERMCLSEGKAVRNALRIRDEMLKNCGIDFLGGGPAGDIPPGCVRAHEDYKEFLRKRREIPLKERGRYMKATRRAAEREMADSYTTTQLPGGNQTHQTGYTRNAEALWDDLVKDGVIKP